ncbi:MAG: pantoate--beta-alanine ligase [Bacteroides sp.]
MQQVETCEELRNLLGAYRVLSRTIGLVPTMGALHAGHVSLIKRALQENDVVVVSDFVNPTQFNNPNDFRTYPRDLLSDGKLVESIGATLFFTPSEKEMYPVQDTRVFSFGDLDKVFEGAHRPGHFNGVGQIVSKLFELVQPTRAYFGEKDYQQMLIIRNLVEQLRMTIEIVPCPIVREADGLAMSSRNQLLDSECRRQAPVIYATLHALCEKVRELPLAKAREWAIEQIEAKSPLHVEYLAFADAQTLQPIAEYLPNKTRCLTAVQAGAVRLIDNIGF